MPFTPSHAAAVLPLRALCRRGWLCWSALVVGSITPDLEYLLLLRGYSRWGHTFAGTFYFCLPVGLLALLLFDCFAKRRWLLLLPAAARRRWAAAAFEAPSLRAWFSSIPLSILIGSWSHLLWDSFTHTGRFGGRWIPQIESVAFTILDRPVLWTNLLQLSSTFIGALILFAAYRQSLSRSAGSDRIAPSIPDLWRHLLVAVWALLPILFALGYAFRRAAYTPGVEYLHAFVGAGARATLSATVLVGLLIAILLARIGHPGGRFRTVSS
jgi:hypothetical protein